MDLRDLFSFDKLRASGRVNILTTEEFLEKEAFAGNLGIYPAKKVEGLGEKVRGDACVGVHKNRIVGNRVFRVGLSDLLVENVNGTQRSFERRGSCGQLVCLSNREMTAANFPIP